MNMTFVDMLTQHINMKGWRDSKVYKAAQIDRRLFSKIMSDRAYKPARDTALALAIALELTLQQTNDLLDRAGYTLSHSNKRDVIIEYFIREGVHNLMDINEVLHKLDQKNDWQIKCRIKGDHFEFLFCYDSSANVAIYD